MKLESIRQRLQPLFGLERTETTSRRLYAILTSTLIVNAAVIVFRLARGTSLVSLTLTVLFSLILLQLALLSIVRRGYISAAAHILVLAAWVGATFLAWRANGLYDAALYIYVLIMLVAALLTSWLISTALTVISIGAIWVFAVTEARVPRVLQLDSPLEMASDLTAIFIILFFLVHLVIHTVRDSVDAARQGEEKFRRIFRVSPVAIAIASLDEGRILDANQAYWKLTGLDEASTLENTVLELGAWSDASEREKIVAALQQQKSIKNPAYRFKSQSGEYRTTLAFYELIDFENEPAIMAMFYDITDQKKTEQALRRSDARTRALLAAIPDLIFEFKRDGTIVDFISASDSRPLLPPEQFLGRPIQEILPSVAEQTLFSIDRVLESGQVHAFQYQLELDGEVKTYEARISPLSTDTVLAIVRNVSLQQWILGERETLINELESKNAELERFTYTVSHDLKSPLITIKGFLGFLRQDAQTGNFDRLNADIQRIAAAADKMQALLNDLLELSRIGRLVNQPETIVLDKMIAAVLELLHGRLHGGSIRVSVQENLPQIYGDRSRIFEVFQNLIDNAAKFMGDQSNPRIEIGQQGSTESGFPIIFIRDNGMGIDPKFQDRIFGLFDKLDPRSEGTGIGLAVVKRIIEFHGGRVWVESEPAKGATFYFSLPNAEYASKNSG